MALQPRNAKPFISVSEAGKATLVNEVQPLQVPSASLRYYFGLAVARGGAGGVPATTNRAALLR